MKIKFRKLALAVAVGAAISGGVSAPALAATPAPGPGPNAPAITPLQGTHVKSTGGAAPQAAIGLSPAGCYGQTDFAHKSGTESSVHGRTRCSFNVTTISVTTTLWNLAWFGWNPLNSGTKTKSGVRDSTDATPHYGCSSSDPHEFYGSSTHYSIESGTTYSGSTSSDVQTFRC